MHVRELSCDEWPAFFDAFSRHYRGRPVTVELAAGDDGHSRAVVARRMPLLGVSAEPRHGRVAAIELLLGDDGDAPGAGHLSHVVHEPARVKVAQVSNGEDEVLIIEPVRGPATEIDFRLARVHKAVDA